MPSAPLISLENAGMRQANKWLVRDVSFTLSRGEIVTLIGPNGSGKSTTAKMALGILRPSAGHCHRAKGLTVGYVPQKLHFDATLPLTVNRLMQLSAKLSPQEIDVALEQTEVAGLKNAQVQHLSGGELQRVLLARALARQPDVLVLDEPVQGVDFAGEVALYELILKVRDQLGCGILMISHDLHVVMAATDKVICLNGHVCCQGTPGAVVQNAQYQKLFGPSSGVHAIYSHHHDHEHLEDGRVRHKDGSITDHCDPVAEQADAG